MNDYKEFIQQHAQQLDLFFANTDALVFVILDKDIKITGYNQCFSKLIQSNADCYGKSIQSFLLPESKCILPLSDTTDHLSVGLNFISSESSPVPLFCHIFKIDNNSHLILGGQLMLTNDEILQKMTALTNDMANISRDLNRKNRELEEAHSKIKVLSGIIPICMYCKEIRDDQGYWNRLEKFITEHSEAQFSHGICDKCFEERFSDNKLKSR